MATTPHKAPPPRRIGLLYKVGSITALLLVGACSGLQSRLFDTVADHWMRGYPIVNSLILSADDSGVRLLSMGRVNGERLAPDRWAAVGVIDAFAAFGVTLQAPSEHRQSIERFLDDARGDCASARQQLTSALVAASAAQSDARWLHMKALPSVDLRLLPPSAGVLYVESSAAAEVAGLRMHLVQALPESQTCSWIRQWAADVAETIVHEQVHVGIFQRFGPGVARLANELAASMVGLCVRLEFLGELPDRRVLLPGHFEATLATVLGLLEDGRITTSLAGTAAADIVRREVFAGRKLTAADRPEMRALCDRATLRMVNLRDSSDLHYLIGRANWP